MPSPHWQTGPCASRCAQRPACSHVFKGLVEQLVVCLFLLGGHPFRKVGLLLDVRLEGGILVEFTLLAREVGALLILAGGVDGEV